MEGSLVMQMPSLSRTCLLVAFAVAVVSAATIEEPFGYGGYRLDTDWASVLDRFPRASHEVIPGVGAKPRTSQEDERDWIREFLQQRRASGTYQVRFTTADVRDHIYDVHVDVHEGVAHRLRISFEAPLAPTPSHRSVKDNEARYPSCELVLGALVRRYDQARPQAPSQEEALIRLEYVWTRPHEEMTLTCERYDGRRFVFASELTLVRTDDRAPDAANHAQTVGVTAQSRP